MVADFEEVCPQMTLVEHALLAIAFGVTFEEGRGVAVGEPEDERVVVGGIATGMISGLRREHANGNAAEGEGVSGDVVADVGAVLGGIMKEVLDDGDVGVWTKPELAGAEVGEDGGHASNMVFVRVGESDGIEAANAARPEDRRDDVFANVEVGVRRREDEPAGVDEESFAGGGDDENGVSLADVDDGDFKLAGAIGNGARQDENDSGGGDGGEGERDSVAAEADDADGDGEEGDPERDGKVGWHGDAHVREAQASECSDDAGDGVEDGGGGGSGDESECGDEDKGREGEERAWQEESEEGNDEHIDGKREECDAMEVGSHGQHHEELDGDRDGEQLDEAQE